MRAAIFVRIGLSKGVVSAMKMGRAEIGSTMTQIVMKSLRKSPNIRPPVPLTPAYQAGGARQTGDFRPSG